MPPTAHRIVHLGLGAFARAHLAWYTHLANATAPDDEQWTICGFSGRGQEPARSLVRQGLRYTLIERAADGDSAHVVTVLEDARAGTDVAGLRRAIADPRTAVVSLTVTEAGYHVRDDGVIARLVDALAARRAAASGPLALMSCDNLRGNGSLLRRAVLARAQAHNLALADWIASAVTFPDTVVDRITPATVSAETVMFDDGSVDAVPVVTEPFREWIIAGEFPAGRPTWEVAGARFVPDIAAYEQCKLWLLNGAHSLLASLGLFTGHNTVAEAMTDPMCAHAVEALWRDARTVLDLPAPDLDTACAAMRLRFANPRIEHRLDQIARDGSLKLPVRILDPLRRVRARGAAGAGLCLAIAAWAAVLTPEHLVRSPDAGDPGSPPAGSTPVERADWALRALDPSLVDDPVVTAQVRAQVRDLLDR